MLPAWPPNVILLTDAARGGVHAGGLLHAGVQKQGDHPVSTGFFPIVIRSVRVWLRYRSKHRAQALATLELSHESDQFLSDIGLSRGGVKANHPGDPDAWFR